MTLREKLLLDHPNCVDSWCDGGCKGCPKHYGYESVDICAIKEDNYSNCRECWDQEYINPVDAESSTIGANI